MVLVIVTIRKYKVAHRAMIRTWRQVLDRVHFLEMRHELFVRLANQAANLASVAFYPVLFRVKMLFKLF